MARNVFEIIVQSGYSSIQDSAIPFQFVGNTEFDLFLPISQPYNYQTFPESWDLQGAWVDLPTPFTGVLTTIPIYNALFDEDFLNDTTATQPSIHPNGYYANAHSSFYTPEGWSVFHSSIANDGLNAAKTNEIELDTTNGYDYYNGDTGAIIPELQLRSMASSSSILATRVGVELDFSALPDSTNSLSTALNGGTLDYAYQWRDTPFSSRHNRQVEIGSIRTLNAWSSSPDLSSIVNNNQGIRIASKDITDNIYTYLFGFSFMDSVLHNTEEDFNTLNTSKYIDVNPIPNPYTPRNLWEAKQPTALRLENIFTDAQIGGFVEYEVDLALETTTHVIKLPLSYDSVNFNFSTGALNFTVNTSTGAVTSVGDTFKPHQVNEISNGLWSDMTSEISINNGRLRLAATSISDMVAVRTPINFNGASTHILSVKVNSTSHDYSNCSIVERYTTNLVSWMYEDTDLSIGVNKWTFDVDDVTDADGYLKEYDLLLWSNGGGASAVTEYDYIRCELKQTPAGKHHPIMKTPEGELYGAFASYGSSVLNKVQTASKFKTLEFIGTSSPVDDIEKRATEISGTTTSSQTINVTNATTLLDQFPSRVILTKFFEPNGTPNFTEEQSCRVDVHAGLDEDVDGQITTDGNSVKTFKFKHKIGSTHLNLFLDTYSPDEVVTSRFIIKSIRFLTSENSRITKAEGANGDAISFKHNIQTSEVNPPYIVNNTALTTEEQENPQTLSWDIDSLSGESLVIDFGDNTPATTISTAGAGTASVIPSGEKLRIRLITEAEKGSPIVANTEAIINSVGMISEMPIDAFVKAEVYGNNQSINSQLPYIGAYDSAFRIHSYNAQDNLATPHVGGMGLIQHFQVGQNMSAYFLLSEMLGADFNFSINIDVEVLHLAANNYIVVEDYLGATVQSTTINSTGITTITRTGKDFGGDSTYISLTFNSNAASNLDIILGSIKVTGITSDSSSGSNISLDLNEDLDIPFNFSVKDFNEISKTSGDFSKTIKIPATTKNKKALNFKNELSSLNQDSDNTGVPCVIKADGLEIIKTNLYLFESSLNEFGFEELSLNAKSGNSSWADILSSVNLRDIPSNYVPINSSMIQLNQLGIDAAFQQGDWDIGFPLIDNGKWEVPSSEQLDETFVGWSNLKASFSIKKVIEEILSLQTITLNSSFFGSEDEWSSDFSDEFLGLPSRIYGVAPEMTTHEDDINASIFKATKNAQSAEERSNWMSLVPYNLQNNRPLLNSKILGTDYKWVADWCYTKLNEVTISGTSTHQLASVTGNLGGIWTPSSVNSYTNTTASLPRDSKLQSTVDTDRSVITVARDGYYEVNIQVAVDFHSWTHNESNTVGSNNIQNGYYYPNPTVYQFTSLLVASEGGGESIINTEDGSWGANIFDLEDEAGVEIPSDLFSSNGVNYNLLGTNGNATGSQLTDTRLSFNRVQFLKAGTPYNIVSFFGLKVDSYKASIAKVFSSNRFKIKELDIEMKLTKSIAPMNGKNAIVYSSAANPKVSYREILPNVTCLDFISEITKLFNLIWSYNPYTRVLTTEPYGEFYDFEETGGLYTDWSKKALITKIKEGAIASADFEFKMKKDGSDYLIGVDGSNIPLGDSVVYSNSSFADKKAKSLELKIFSATAMGVDSHIRRKTNGSPDFQPEVMPRIHSSGSSTLEANINEEKPDANNSHEYKILYKSVTEDFWNANYSEHKIHYSLEKEWVTNSNGMWDGEFRPVIFATSALSKYFSYDIAEGSPNLTFSEQVSGDSMYSTYHKKLFDMASFRDKMITADVYLTTYDIMNLDFSKLIRIDNEVYILNKIKDFNFSGEPTEVELLLVTIIE